MTFLCLVVSVHAQDYIYKTDKTVLRTIVEEINSDNIKYKLFDETEDLVYVIKKVHVDSIKFSSGRVDVYDKTFQYLSYDIEAVRPGLKYRDLQYLYDLQDYAPSYMDRYTPSSLGIASFFIPGLGECLMQEWGRGLWKFFSTSALLATGSVFMLRSNFDYSPYWEIDIAVGAISYGAALGIWVWSIIDAVQIAKITNMYYEDLKTKYAVSLDLHPTILNDLSTKGNGMAPAMALTITF